MCLHLVGCVLENIASGSGEPLIVRVEIFCEVLSACGHYFGFWGDHRSIQVCECFMIAPSSVIRIKPWPPKMRKSLMFCLANYGGNREQHSVLCLLTFCFSKYLLVSVYRIRIKTRNVDVAIRMYTLSCMVWCTWEAASLETGNSSATAAQSFVKPKNLSVWTDAPRYSCFTAVTKSSLLKSVQSLSAGAWALLWGWETSAPKPCGQLGLPRLQSNLLI